MQADEADVTFRLVEDRPGEIILALGLDLLEEELLLLPGDAEIVLERRRDLGIVEPDQGILEVKRPIGRDQPDALALQSDDVAYESVRLGVERSVLGVSPCLLEPVRQGAHPGPIEVRRLERRRG